MPYLPIEDYGLIGNMQTAALVGRNGSIDWLCLPHFDSPSVFAAILDDEKGGRFKIAPRDGQVVGKQVYWPDTNILMTRFLLDEGVVEVTDYMPVGLERGTPGYRQLVRRVEAIRGAVPIHVLCQPRFNYAREGHTVSMLAQGVVFESNDLALQLLTPAPLLFTGPSDAQGVETELSLRQGDRMTFVLRILDPKHASGPVLSDELEQRLFEITVAYWHRWVAQCTYVGRWRETVTRSALLLKMLTFEPTGALVAAPTTSLPESIPGPRNWDYRHTWIRDSSFSLYALLRLGFTTEASSFMNWLEHRCQERRVNSKGKPPYATGGLQIMYGLHGETDIPEQTLDHLEGYRGCRPVRVGNAASHQLQLDIYGELMDSVYLHSKYNARVSWDMWENLLDLMEWLCDHWQTPDEGIWETRSGRQHFTYSKVMCWVALDRALRVAWQQSLPAPHDRWIKCRDQIYTEVMSQGWSHERHAFVQHYGTQTLDASTLIMPLVQFIAPNDPRMLLTLQAICRDPLDGGLLSNSLVYRYDTEKFHDGMGGREGTFNMCTFWLVEALTLAGQSDPHRLDQAALIFEKMLGYANHLGLFAEETGVRGEALGNFPQAFTHLSLISAAYNLDQAMGRRGAHW